MSDPVADLQAGAGAVATLIPTVSVFLHGLIRRPIITADDVAVPLAGPALEDALRANLSRRISTGTWNETEED